MLVSALDVVFLPPSISCIYMNLPPPQLKSEVSNTLMQLLPGSGQHGAADWDELQKRRVSSSYCGDVCYSGVRGVGGTGGVCYCGMLSRRVLFCTVRMLNWR